MLQSMAKKVEEEGEKEKDLYEKYMCYCKTSGATLQEGIAAAETKAPQVSSSIEEGKSEKVQLEAALKEAKAGREEALAAIASAEALRSKESGEFTKEEADLSANIAALGKAITAVSSGMGGSFLQTQAAKDLKRMLVQSESISSDDQQLLSSFLENTAEYVPQSGEIVGILKQIKEEMEKSLAASQGQEAEAKANAEALIAAKKKEIAAHTAAIEEKSTRIGKLGVSIAEMSHDLEDTEEALAEDKKFLADMDANCKSKEAEWDSISKLRAEELVAISETIKILNDDDALELFKKTLPTTSLMQVTSTTRALEKKAYSIVTAARTGAPASSRSGLDLIALALSGKKVSFEKVFKLIDELVATLAKEQQDDDHKKEYCEAQFDTSDDSKKAVEAEIEDLKMAMEEAEGLMSSLKDEIKALTDGIKALDKEVASATETRKEEHETFTELLSSDSAAKELLGVAKNRLQKFYNPKLYKPAPERVLSEEDKISVAFGGTPPPTEAPGGIAGTGVMALVQLHSFQGSDVAPPPPPESFSAYAKKAEMSNGILKMLDMLVADLDKEMDEASVEEKNAQAAYEAFMEDAASKRALDSKSLTNKEAAKAEAESDLMAAKEGKAAKKSELMAVEEYISDLHGQCDWLLKNFDLRKTARAAEVDSLKSAKAVLSGADYSLVQRTATRSLRG